MNRLRGFLPLSLFVHFLFTSPAANAGRNAGGALIVHTDDRYTYSQGTACTTPSGVPASCETATTRTDKSEGSVVVRLWVAPGAGTKESIHVDSPVDVGRAEVVLYASGSCRAAFTGCASPVTLVRSARR